MLIPVSMDSVVMVSDFIHAHNFCHWIANPVKVLLFLLWTKVHQCFLKIRKKILVLIGDSPTDWLHDTKIREEAWLDTKMTKTFLYANGVKVYQFKANISEINSSAFCLENIAKDLQLVTLKKNTEWKRVQIFW